MVQFAYATHNADSHHRLLFDSRTTMKLNFVLRVFLLAAGTFGWMDGCERTTHSHSSTSSPRDIPIEFNRFDCQQKRRNGPRSYFQLIWLAPFVPPSVLLTIQGFRIIIMQRLIGTRRHMVSRKSFANHSPPVLTLSPDTTFLTRRPLEHADSPHVQPLKGSIASSS